VERGAVKSAPFSVWDMDRGGGPGGGLVLPSELMVKSSIVWSRSALLYFVCFACGRLLA
jgi:hypothetical protein